MFRKAFHTRSNIAIRGSDRRKLRSTICEQFPRLDADQVAELTPNKDDMTVMKIITHADCIVYVYCLTGTPVFFQIEKQLYPTVYTLWKHPDLLPSLSTWPPVLDKISGGADLMLPGVVPQNGGLPQLSKGQLCAIALVGNQAAVAIGRASMATVDMVANGMKGRGVQVIHCFKDMLWSIGDKSPLPDIPLPNLEVDSKDRNSSDPSSSPEQGNPLPDAGQDEKGLHLDGLSLEDASARAAGDDVRVGEQEEVEEEDPISASDRMDKLLYQCTLHCLKSSVKSTDLPLLTSNFYRSHIVPCCPEDQTLDMKKSSFKKLSKFLQMLQGQGLLKVKEEKKGIDFIVSVDKDHPDLRSFIVPTSTSETQDPRDSKNQPAASGGGSFQVKLLCGVSGDMLPVLRSSGYSKGDWMTHETLRDAVTNYIRLNDLVDKADAKFVYLDGTLHDALINRSEGYVDKLRWDQLFSRCNGKMTSGYEVLVGGQRSSNPKSVRKGKLQPIQLKIEKKSGNKNVTVIQNLEFYGIEPKEFAHRLQVGVAASSSISQMPGQGSGSQVIIQGKQIRFIETLLTDHYNIPKKHIQGLELAAKTGKKKR
ncbi:eukaryotic translation initiation factor 2D-like [Asterias amurensis]|uniref:eukaryotic translation initiation factor 2D-like n=1 Tax=Asterias amurensis TaxID=7602 RepID=UPI003AB84EF7